MDKFKLIAYAIFVIFALALIGGFLYLEGAGRPTSSFVVFAGTILGPALAFGGSSYLTGKQGEKLDAIKTQTNGTLSAEREENRRLVALLMEKHGVDPAQLSEVAPKSVTALELSSPEHRAE